jgi:hypothetical protein
MTDPKPARTTPPREEKDDEQPLSTPLYADINI